MFFQSNWWGLGCRSYHHFGEPFKGLCPWLHELYGLPIRFVREALFVSWQQQQQQQQQQTNFISFKLLTADLVLHTAPPEIVTPAHLDSVNEPKAFWNGLREHALCQVRRCLGWHCLEPHEGMAWSRSSSSVTCLHKASLCLVHT